MGMDHQLGQPGLINWQNHKLRRAKPRGSWALLGLIVSLIAAVAVVAQLAGRLDLPGVLVALPAAVLIVAVNAQLFGAVRAALAWLGG